MGLRAKNLVAVLAFSILSASAALGQLKTLDITNGSRLSMKNQAGAYTLVINDGSQQPIISYALYPTGLLESTPVYTQEADSSGNERLGATLWIRAVEYGLPSNRAFLEGVSRDEYGNQLISLKGALQSLANAGLLKDAQGKSHKPEDLSEVTLKIKIGTRDKSVVLDLASIESGQELDLIDPSEQARLAVIGRVDGLRQQILTPLDRASLSSGLKTELRNLTEEGQRIRGNLRSQLVKTLIAELQYNDTQAAKLAESLLYFASAGKSTHAIISEFEAPKGALVNGKAIVKSANPTGYFGDDQPYRPKVVKQGCQTPLENVM